MNIYALKLKLAAARLALYAWDESKHPRHPSGSEAGGEFAPGGGGSGAPTEPVTVISAGDAVPGFRIQPPKGFVKDITHPSGLLARKVSSGEWVIFRPQGPGEPGIKLGVAANPQLAQVLMDKLGK